MGYAIFDNFEVFLDCFAADGTCMLNGLRHGQKFDRYKTIHNTGYTGNLDFETGYMILGIILLTEYIVISG